MHERKTLVILSPAFPPDEAESNWLSTHQLLIKAIKKSSPGLHIIVLAFLYPENASSYSWNGADVISFNGVNKKKVKHAFLWYDIWKELKRIRKQNNVIGLLSFWCGECALIGSWFGKLYSIRHYCWICGQDARKQNRLVKFIRPAAGELVAMSDFLVQEFYRSHSIRPAHMIPAAIDKALYDDIVPAGRDIDIMAAGNFAPLKRYDLFVEAVRLLAQAVPGIKAVHCGEGEEKENLQSLIRKYKLENNISLLGELPRGEVLRLMQRSRVFLHPSAYEGFGVVNLEALYAGAHVISCCYPLDHPVPHWHVADNAKEMAAKALQLLQDAGTAYTPVMVFTMDESAKAFMRLFDIPYENLA